MIRAACFLAVLGATCLTTAHAQPQAVRVAMLLDHWTLDAHELETPRHQDAVADSALVDPWLGRDKVLHAVGSFLMTLSEVKHGFLCRECQPRAFFGFWLTD